MIKRNNERANRNLALMLVINAYTLVWQGLVSFVTAFGLFTGSTQNALTANANASKNIKGNAKDKKAKRTTATIFALQIKGAVQAYANSIGDITLFDSVNKSKSELLYGKATQGLANCQVIYDSANANLANLANFGITAQVLLDFLASITAYSDALAAPRNAKAKRETFNAQVTQFLDDADNALHNQLVGLMEKFRNTAPQFYSDFTNDNKLIHGATNYTEIIATVVNSVTGQPEFGVTMAITSPDHNYSVTTSVFGIAMKQQMSASLYDVTFSKAGFVSQTVTGLDMHLGELETLAIQLVPVA